MSNMKSTLNSLITLFGSMQSQIDQNMEDWKDRIRDEWEKSKHYPRKKKKRIRKGLSIDWAFANYKPMDHFTW